MGIWKNENTVITNLGLNLLASFTGNGVLKITKAVAGSDFIPEGELVGLTNITHIKQQLTFSDFKVNGMGRVEIEMYLDNADIKEPYYHQQIGLFAENKNGDELLFLVAQATAPDYIGSSDTPVFITHKLVFEYDNGNNISVNVDYAGVVTTATLNEALNNKENTINPKQTAFNCDFAENSSTYRMPNKASAGVLNLVARADHIHPMQQNIMYAENAWETSRTQLVADTDAWQKQSVQQVTKQGAFALDVTFSTVWGQCSYEFTSTQLSQFLGRALEIGVETLNALTGKIELIVDEIVVFTLTPQFLSGIYVVPQDARKVVIRAVVFGESLNLSFTGLHIFYALQQEDSSNLLYFSVRKIRYDNIIKTGVIPGTLYITENGSIYLGQADKSLLPLSGIGDVNALIDELETTKLLMKNTIDDMNNQTNALKSDVALSIENMNQQVNKVKSDMENSVATSEQRVNNAIATIGELAEGFQYTLREW